MMQNIVVFVTCENQDEAGKIAGALVEKRLAACANILPNVRSVFHWQGAVEDEDEVLMIIKTRHEVFDRLAGVVTELHSYDVPEIIALPIVAGNAPYLDWIENEVKEAR